MDKGWHGTETKSLKIFVPWWCLRDHGLTKRKMKNLYLVDKVHDGEMLSKKNGEELPSSKGKANEECKKRHAQKTCPIR